MTECEKYEEHIKSAAWYKVLSEAANDDDDGASIFRMARMAAIEAWQASRRAALEEAAKAVGALHERISAQEIIGFDAWSAGHLALDNAACHIVALATGDTNNG